MNSDQLQQEILQLLESQMLAVLATSDMGRPYASLVAFYSSPDMRTIYFTTPRATRKYKNVNDQPQVAFLVDSRANKAEDFHQAVAVTVLAQCEEVAEENKQEVAGPFLEKHPYLNEFVNASTTALFAANAEKYIYVSHFQEVLEYKVTDQV